MIGILRSLTPFLAIGTLLSACSQDCGTGAGCPKPSPAQARERTTDGNSGPTNSLNPGVSKAEAFFVRYLHDPSNEGSWQWLCRAAANGYAPAQYALAVRYRDGSSSAAPNSIRAHAWFTLAQQNGLTAAAIAREELAKTMTKKQLEWSGTVRTLISEADCDNPQH